jgi:uncharacterized protein YgiM (DUF1202 family)
MKSYKFLRYPRQSHFQQLRYHWLVLVLLLLLTLAIFYAGTTMAAPVNQTVPAPTPTSANTPIPTATTAQNNDDDDDDDDPSPIVVATATPEGLRATVAVVRLNVREGPGTTFAALGVITSGQSVEVLARNEAGDWWQICCLPGTESRGWVASQFLQANFDLSQASLLIPLAGDLPTPPEPTPIPFEDPNAFAATSSGLQFQIQQDPLYTWQGQEVTLVYQIANTTITDTTNLELRNELSTQLRFVAIEETGGGTAMTETTALSNTIFSITWPELVAGEEVTARVRVQVAEDLPDGSVIDNLAVIVADSVAAVTGGISIGLPPTTLPEFR